MGLQVQSFTPAWSYPNPIGGGRCLPTDARAIPAGLRACKGNRQSSSRPHEVQRKEVRQDGILRHVRAPFPAGCRCVCRTDGIVQAPEIGPNHYPGCAKHAIAAHHVLAENLRALHTSRPQDQAAPVTETERRVTGNRPVGWN